MYNCDAYAAGSFHIHTQLPDGRQSILVDPGSVGNLCGDKWARNIARLAHKNGMKPLYEERDTPLKVSGVGNGHQECHFDCKLPVSLKPISGETPILGKLTIPSVPESELPGLLGLAALRKNRAVLDFSSLKLHFCGPGDIKIESGLPAGTESFQLETAPSGHIVLPCCEYKNADGTNNSSLTLMARLAHPDSAEGRRAKAARVPPPPTAPPRFPEEMRKNIEEADPSITLEGRFAASSVRLPLVPLLTTEEKEQLNL